MSVLPTPSKAIQEIVLTLIGVIGAAWVISNWPELKAWIAANGTQSLATGGGCNCAKPQQTIKLWPGDESRW